MYFSYSYGYVSFTITYISLCFISATQFLSSWASSAGVNLLFNSGLYSSSEVKVVSLDDGSSFYVAELMKEPKKGEIQI